MSEHDHAETLGGLLEERFGRRDAVSVTATDGSRYRLSFPDRTIVVSRGRGPDEAAVWTLTLRSDDETVGKFGPLETAAAVRDRIDTLADAAVQYTVCCDG